MIAGKDAAVLRCVAIDLVVASQTVSVWSRSSYGDVRLRLARQAQEVCVGILIDVAAFVRRTLGF